MLLTSGSPDRRWQRRPLIRTAATRHPPRMTRMPRPPSGPSATGPCRPTISLGCAAGSSAVSGASTPRAGVEGSTLSSGVGVAGTGAGGVRWQAGRLAPSMTIRKATVDFVFICIACVLPIIRRSRFWGWCNPDFNRIWRGSGHGRHGFWWKIYHFAFDASGASGARSAGKRE